jgi:hypothetical protein
VRKNGTKNVPCVLIEGESFADIGIMSAGFFGEALVMSDRPPTFADFFSDRLAPMMRLKPWTKIVRVRAEESMLPVILPDVAIQKEERVLVEEVKPEGVTAEDFKIEKEDWNVYRLSDRTILKVRQLLVKVTKPAALQEGQPNLQLQTSALLTATLSPTKIKGPPDTRQYTPQELSGFVVEPNMKFKTIHAAVNEYATTSGMKVLLQFGRITVGRTSKYDANGDPQYLVEVQTNIQLVPSVKNP